MCCDVDACTTVYCVDQLVHQGHINIYVLHYTVGCTWTFVKIDGSSECMRGPGIQSSNRSIVVIGLTDLGMLTHQQACCMSSAEYAIRLPASACNLAAWTYMSMSARYGTT